MYHSTFIILTNLKKEKFYNILWICLCLTIMLYCQVSVMPKVISLYLKKNYVLNHFALMLYFSNTLWKPAVSKRQLTAAALTCCMRACVGEARATVVRPWTWPCRAAALICCCRSNACLCWYICSWAEFSLLLAITAHQPVLTYSTDSLPKPAD